MPLNDYQEAGRLMRCRLAHYATWQRRLTEMLSKWQHLPCASWTLCHTVLCFAVLCVIFSLISRWHLIMAPAGAEHMHTQFVCVCVLRCVCLCALRLLQSLMGNYVMMIQTIQTKRLS